MSKADAKDWWEEQQREKDLEEEFEQAKSNLRYCARRKSSHLPSSEVFNKMGMSDVATLIEQAYELFEQADTLVYNKENC